MPSLACSKWNDSRAERLDEIEDAHEAIGGRGRGRRHATHQINRAYAVLLSAEFQGFCRDLYTEAADHIIGKLLAPTAPTSAQLVVREQFTFGRKLDGGNPTPGNLGHDFARLGLDKLWDKVKALSPQNKLRHKRLESLNEWRNAIAHQNVRQPKIGGRTTLRLGDVRAWRSACNQLVPAFERVIHDHVLALVGSRPWK